MHNIHGFLRWQVIQFRKISWYFIFYFVALIMVLVGSTMEPETAPLVMDMPLDIVLIASGSILIMAWLVVLGVQIQYQRYMYERARIERELKKETN